jgi:alpha-D-xyloside xylohydrolase
MKCPASLAIAFSVSVYLSAFAAAQQPNLPPVIATQSAHGMSATIGSETLAITVCSDTVIHVVTRPDGDGVSHPQPWLLPADQSCPGAPSQFAQDRRHATLKTAKLAVSLALDRGNLSISTVDGHSLLRERDLVPRTYVPTTIGDRKTLHVVDRFSPDSTEAFYGLGQHQSGMFNYRGSTVELGQNNTDIAIPLLVSSKGYAVLWNTASFTYVDNRFPLELSFDTMDEDGVDFYLIYGPELDQVIHGYRDLTGHAPMLPRWSYGFIQSKDRYQSMDEMQTIVDRYRREQIPIDAIVQDWFWWKTEGDPIFNRNYHDVPGDLKKLHDAHVHTMISTWGLIDPKAETYAKLEAIHGLIPGAHVYDASNPQARDLYWKSLIAPLFAQGWDSFWLDSAEPEEAYPHVGDAILRDKQIAIGSGTMYTNVFPFLHNQGVQDHWRATTDAKRVFLLTRSAFLGQQRVGATVWSGDVYSSFWALKRQVSAGLNFALSGMPYWTTDIGGYHLVSSTEFQDPAYQELYLRWFEFGTFCPIFRTHGHRPNNELWAYPNVEPALVSYDKLRYRLMPYIYSLAARVSTDDYTIMRPLVMDFRDDPNTWNIGDQFLFGPALLVSPVLEAKAADRRLYLPSGAQWYDFWSGQTSDGGKYIDASAPLDRIPLYVRAGSILPMGPDEQYAGEKPDGPIELRVYRGADGHFDLYQDEGDGYGYEKGQRSVIPISWSEANHALTFGARTGSYPGMTQSLSFHVVWVGANHGTGGTRTNADATIAYTGAEQTLRAN